MQCVWQCIMDTNCKATVYNGTSCYLYHNILSNITTDDNEGGDVSYTETACFTADEVSPITQTK